MQKTYFSKIPNFWESLTKKSSYLSLMNTEKINNIENIINPHKYVKLAGRIGISGDLFTGDIED